MCMVGCSIQLGGSAGAYSMLQVQHRVQKATMYQVCAVLPPPPPAPYHTPEQDWDTACMKWLSTESTETRPLVFDGI